MGEMTQFPANGQITAAYLALPSSAKKGGRGPGLLLIQEWWGLVDHIKAVADRAAREGFVALAPDLYHGKTTRSPDEAGKLFMALNVARAAADLRGAAEFLHAHPAVSPKKVAALGFCMGGQLALFAGAQYPDRIAALVDFYGIHPNVKVDPSKVRVPVLGHFGKRDAGVKEKDARDLVDRIRAAGGAIEAHFYDADHAFFNDTRPEVFNREAAELAWKRTLEFLRQHLT